MNQDNFYQHNKSLSLNIHNYKLNGTRELPVELIFISKRGLSGGPFSLIEYHDMASLLKVAQSVTAISNNIWDPFY